MTRRVFTAGLVQLSVLAVQARAVAQEPPRIATEAPLPQQEGSGVDTLDSGDAATPPPEPLVPLGDGPDRPAWQRPLLITRFTSDDLAARPARTGWESLAEAPGVASASDGRPLTLGTIDGLGISPRLWIDGLPAGSRLFGPRGEDIALWDLQGAHRVELIHGDLETTHGLGGASGAIQLWSRPLAYGAAPSVRVTARADSADGGFSISPGITAARDRVALDASGTFDRHGDLSTPDGTLDESGYTRTAGHLRLGAQLGGRATVQLTWQAGRFSSLEDASILSLRSADTDAVTARFVDDYTLTANRVAAVLETEPWGIVRRTRIQAALQSIDETRRSSSCDNITTDGCATLLGSVENEGQTATNGITWIAQASTLLGDEAGVNAFSLTAEAILPTESRSFSVKQEEGTTTDQNLGERSGIEARVAAQGSRAFEVSPTLVVRPEIGVSTLHLGVSREAGAEGAVFGETHDQGTGVAANASLNFEVARRHSVWLRAAQSSALATNGGSTPSRQLSIGSHANVGYASGDVSMTQTWEPADASGAPFAANGGALDSLVVVATQGEVGSWLHLSLRGSFWAAWYDYASRKAERAYLRALPPSAALAVRWTPAHETYVEISSQGALDAPASERELDGGEVLAAPWTQQTEAWLNLGLSGQWSAGNNIYVTAGATNLLDERYRGVGSVLLESGRRGWVALRFAR